MRVRIELLDVVCRDTEDVTGADTLYLVGGASDGIQQRPVITSRMWINTGQIRAFAPDQQLVFDAEVPPGRMVHVGLQAYDEDAGKDWAKHGAWITKLAQEIATQLEQLPRDTTQPPPTDPTQPQNPDPRQVVAGLLRAAAAAANFFVPLDKDDFLGSLAVDLPLGAPGSEIREWTFNSRSTGWWSSWRYTVRYRVTREGAMADIADGTLLNEQNTEGIFVVFGGAKFWVPSSEMVEFYGGWNKVQTVPSGALSALLPVPREGTLLRERSSDPVYRMQNNQRCWILSATALERYGGWGAVRVVPDGQLAAIPEGPQISN